MTDDDKQPDTPDEPPEAEIAPDQVEDKPVAPDEPPQAAIAPAAAEGRTTTSDEAPRSKVTPDQLEALKRVSARTSRRRSRWSWMLLWGSAAAVALALGLGYTLRQTARPDNAAMIEGIESSVLELFGCRAPSGTEIDLRFISGPDGAMRAHRLLGNGNAVASACLLRQIGNWRLPEFAGEGFLIGELRMAVTDDDALQLTRNPMLRHVTAAWLSTSSKAFEKSELDPVLNSAIEDVEGCFQNPAFMAPGSIPAQVELSMSFNVNEDGDVPTFIVGDLRKKKFSSWWDLPTFTQCIRAMSHTMQFPAHDSPKLQRVHTRIRFDVTELFE